MEAETGGTQRGLQPGDIWGPRCRKRQEGPSLEPLDLSGRPVSISDFWSPELGENKSLVLRTRFTEIPDNLRDINIPGYRHLSLLLRLAPVFL